MRKRLLSTLLALCLALALLPGTAFAADSGKCGDNVTWSLSNGVLTIQGTGPMHDYAYYVGEELWGEPVPWGERTREIHTVIIGDGVTSIGGGAFGGLFNLTGVTIPNSVTSIGINAFAACVNLTSVTIPGSVTTIGKGAFQECWELTSVAIPNSVTSIGDEAFLECSSLTGVTIPDSVTSIGAGAFANCGLTSVTIPAGVTYIGASAFFCDIWVESGNPAYTSVDGILFNADKTLLHSYPTGKDGQSYSIPASVTAIGEGAFGKSSLTSVTIPGSVTSIGKSAFSSSSLTSITIPGSVTSIGEGAFYACTRLTSVTIANGVTSIGANAFDSCHNLTSIVIPESVTSIGDAAFYLCDSLTSVTIPGNVTIIEGHLFSLCTKLTSVFIPGSVTSIGILAFNTNSITDIYFGGSESQWKQISIDNTLNANDVLFKANIHYNSAPPKPETPTEPETPTKPESPTSGSCGANVTWSYSDGVLTIQGTGPMDDYHDPETNNLSEIPWARYRGQVHTIKISDGVTGIGSGAFILFSNLTSVTIPNSVTSIGAHAFTQCDSLTSVTIPASVATIDMYAFYRCSSLTSVTIPASVTTIGPLAFVYCDSLADVYYGGSESQWEQIDMDSAGNLFSATIHYNSPMPSAPSEPSVSLAYPSTQTVDLDGNEVEFQMYALKDANGNDTNYIKIRDLALALSGTKATFDIGWANGAAAIETGKAYTPNGTENNTPFSGERPYTASATSFSMNGSPIGLEGIVLTDDSGGGYTYCQVKDLADKLNFNARWDSARQIICIETE